MNPRTIAALGGPFQDEKAAEDPVSEVAAAFYDRTICDVAQTTLAIGMTWFAFTTTTTAAVVAVDPANVSVSGVWGSGSAQKPTISKTATGVYEATWPTEFDDELVGVANMDAVAETQQVAFTFASGLNVSGATDGRARVTNLASNVVTIKVYDTSNALSDLGGTAGISGYLR